MKSIRTVPNKLLPLISIVMLLAASEQSAAFFGAPSPVCQTDPAAQSGIFVGPGTDCADFGQVGCEVQGDLGSCVIEDTQTQITVTEGSYGGIVWNSGSGPSPINTVIVKPPVDNACAYQYDPGELKTDVAIGLGARVGLNYETVESVLICSELATEQVTELDACPEEYQALVDAIASDPLDDKKVYAFILDPTQLEKISQCVPSSILDPEATIPGTNIAQYQGCIDQCIADEEIAGSCKASGWVPGVTDNITPYCNEVSAAIREQLSIDGGNNTQPLANVNNVIQVYSVNPVCFVSCGNLGGRYQCTNICF